MDPKTMKSLQNGPEGKGLPTPTKMVGPNVICVSASATKADEGWGATRELGPVDGFDQTSRPKRSDGDWGSKTRIGSGPNRDTHLLLCSFLISRIFLFFFFFFFSLFFSIWAWISFYFLLSAFSYLSFPSKQIPLHLYILPFHNFKFSP